MKSSSSFKVIRSFLYLAVLAGLMLVLFHFLSFETIISLLNRLSPDGEFSSFTLERYQIASKLSGWLGAVFIVFAGTMLVRWRNVQNSIEKLAIWFGEFKKDLRNDADLFWDKLAFKRWDRTDLTLVSGITLVALIMRLASLNIPLIHDEAYTYNAFASRSLWVTISDYHLPNNHVLLTIVINILTHLFGNHLWLIRLPTIIMGVMMAPVTYVLGRRLYSRETGILSAALVAIFPILVEYSVLARGYVPMSLGALLTLILGDHVMKTKDRFAWLLLIVISALGFFTIPVMLLPFGALYVWLFLSCLAGDFNGYRSKMDFLKYWLVSGFASAFLTVALYLPILISNAGQFFGNQFIEPLKQDVFYATLLARLGLMWDDWVFLIPGWLVNLGIAGLIVGLILHWKISKQKVPLQVAFIVWIVAFLILRRPSMMSRMWLFVVAPSLIWSAGGIVETLKVLSNTIKIKLSLARIFVGITLVSVFVLGALTIPTIPARWKQKTSVESAVIYLKENLREGDLVTASVEYFPQMRYYFGVYSVPQDYLRRSAPFKRVFMVIGLRGGATLESVAPRAGNRIEVDLDTVRIVLQFGDLTLYEGDPAP